MKHFRSWLEIAVWRFLKKHLWKPLFALMLLHSSANAGWLTTPIQPAAGGEVDWILAPIGALEFAPSTPSNYGLTLAESIGIARVLPADILPDILVHKL